MKELLAFHRWCCLARLLVLLSCRIRAQGSAAVNMCTVASGRADAYWEFGIHAWDMAAGDLIVREAGGVVLSTDCMLIWYYIWSCLIDQIYCLHASLAVEAGIGFNSFCPCVFIWKQTSLARVNGQIHTYLYSLLSNSIDRQTEATLQRLVMQQRYTALKYRSKRTKNNIFKKLSFCRLL